MVKPVRIAATGSVDIGSVIAGDFADLETVVAEIADQKLEQTMRAYFALVMDVTQHTGNVVDAHGDAAEALLAMLEKMDIAFDDDGTPALQVVVSPTDAERVRAQMAAFTPDQQPQVRRDHHPQEGGIPCFATSSQASSTLSLNASSTLR